MEKTQRDMVQNLINGLGGGTFLDLTTKHEGFAISVVQMLGLATIGVAETVGGSQVAVLTKDEARQVAEALLNYANS